MLNSSFLILNYGVAVNVPQTWADISHANQLFGYKPKTSFKGGVGKIYDWWRKNQSVL